MTFSKLLNKLKAYRAVEVRVDKKSLVAVFHKSSPTLVWRFDLEQNHSFSLALQEIGDVWAFGVNDGRGGFLPVARFVDEADAKIAFARVERALVHRKFFLLHILFRLALLLLAIFIVLGGIYVAIANYVLPGISSMVTSAVTHKPTPKQGVPISADDALSAPTTAGLVPSPPDKKVIENGKPMSADEVLAPPAN